MNYFHSTKRILQHIIVAFVTAIPFLQYSAKAQEPPVLKASFSRDASQPINIDLLMGQSRVIELDEEYDATQFSGDKIVSVAAFTSKVIVINALGIGQANVVVAKKLTAQNQSEQVLVFHVFVQKNLTLIDNQIKILYPKENIQLSQVNDSVVLSGSVTRPDISKAVENILTKAKIDFSNLLNVPASIVQQVQMEVRIAEVNRTALREIGTALGVMNRTIPTFISPSGPAAATVTGGLGQRSIVLDSAATAMNIFLGRPDLTSAFIRALQTRGALRSLAEPNIIALDGKEGKFLSGGKVPIPQVTSASSGQSGFSISYQEFGVKLAFTPTITDENHITIKMDTEVSNISYANGIETNSIRVPGFTTNSASTILELADGQSFALAGLLNNQEQINHSQIPWIASVPVLGELFKSRSFQRNESELMFLCTVRLVTPLNPDQIPRLPGAPLNNATTSTKPATNAPGILVAPTFNSTSPTLSLPSANLLEGDSGHATPKKTTKATLKSDN